MKNLEKRIMEKVLENKLISVDKNSGYTTIIGFNKPITTQKPFTILEPNDIKLIDDDLILMYENSKDIKISFLGDKILFGKVEVKSDALKELWWRLLFYFEDKLDLLNYFKEFSFDSNYVYETLLKPFVDDIEKSNGYKKNYSIIDYYLRKEIQKPTLDNRQPSVEDLEKYAKKLSNYNFYVANAYTENRFFSSFYLRLLNSHLINIFKDELNENLIKIHEFIDDMNDLFDKDKLKEQFKGINYDFEYEQLNEMNNKIDDISNYLIKV